MTKRNGGCERGSVYVALYRLHGVNPERSERATMLRNLLAQIISGFVVCAVLVAWWLSADKDFAAMFAQAWGIITWGAGLVQPLLENLFSNTGG